MGRGARSPQKEYSRQTVRCVQQGTALEEQNAGEERPQPCTSRHTWGHTQTGLSPRAPSPARGPGGLIPRPATRVFQPPPSRLLARPARRVDGRPALACDKQRGRVMKCTWQGPPARGDGVGARESPSPRTSAPFARPHAVVPDTPTYRKASFSSTLH